MSYLKSAGKKDWVRNRRESSAAIQNSPFMIFMRWIKAVMEALDWIENI